MGDLALGIDCSSTAAAGDLRRPTGWQASVTYWLRARAAATAASPDQGASDRTTHYANHD
jgi:hypothetical protein